jgi:TolB protein
MSPTSPQIRSIRPPCKLLGLLSAILIASLAPRAQAQDNLRIDSIAGATSIRIAVANFKPAATDPRTSGLKDTFDSTLYADLASAGIFDIVSKSLMPPTMPGTPAEMQVGTYAAAPASAAMVAFGSLGITLGKLIVNGYLFDTKNPQYPQVLAKQYSEDANEDTARQIAHQFADQIIFRLSGGTPGIAETKIYYVKLVGANKEIWEMDYDGANQHAITNLGTISISPRVSPDNSRLAFSSLGRDGFQIRVYSLLLGKMLNFPAVGGTNLSPAWSPDGREIAYSSSRTGDPEIWISDAGGNLSRRITSIRGPDVSPAYNPKTGTEIAWISGRTGLPQLYMMEADGAAPQRMTDLGYASSPSWSPNGQYIAFAWDRKYGPGAPGGQDIYVMEVATKKWLQLTHDGGRCDFPSWSPDGRHIVYSNSEDGRPDHWRVWTMLTDGTQRRPLTPPGADMPNWSWK